MSVLVVGGAGYIGSHVSKALKQAGFEPVVYDNLSNGHEWAVKWGPLIQGDLLDFEILDETFKTHEFISVIHLASLIEARDETNPAKYYRNNVDGTVNLLKAMARHKVDQLVFSSTAAVYGNPKKVPITEDDPLEPVNVYGHTKKLAEEKIEEYSKLHPLRYVILRYFNAAGADGEIGEAHIPETHLIPLAIMAAQGKNSAFKIFGNDHPTTDGTPIRDYVHVSDLAGAHVKAIEWLTKGGTKSILNLGSGIGYSVQEVIAFIKEKIGTLPHQIVSRNPSDPPVLLADISKAKDILNWSPTKSDLATIISSAVEWHR
jgi:UDP-glucose-4-epimerase GalE